MNRRSNKRATWLRLETLEDRRTPSGFAASVGGPLDDSGLAVAAGHNGNVYVAGKVQLNSPAAAPRGAFVAMYSPSGQAQWTQQIFGDVTDVATAIAVDLQGNAYVTGYIRGVTTFDATHVVTPSFNSSYNGFIEKLDPSGKVVWVEEIDAPLSAGGDAIGLDANGNVYTTGFLAGNARFFGPSGQFVTNPGQTNQVSSFLVKQDTNGNLLWVQQYGVADPNGSGGDESSSNAIAVSPAGDAIYVGGGFRGQNVDFRTNAGLSPTLTLSAKGTTDVFAAKFDAQGNTVWAVRAGSNTILEGAAEAASGIALDSVGSPYITGSFDNTADFGSLQLTGVNGPNTFVAKLDPATGAFVKAVTFGDPGVEVGTGITADQAGHVFVTGWFTQTATLGPFQMTTRGDADVYVAKLDANLNVLIARQMGGVGRDEAFGIAVDPFGFVDTTGSFTQSGNFSLPPNPPVTLTSAGGSDLFVSRQPPKSSPTHAMVVDGHILQIQGTDAASRIALSDDGHGMIQVMLDGDPLRSYQGIDRIEVMAGDGNDVVSYQLGGPDTIDNPDLQPADLLVDLGNGKNSFMLDAHLAEQAPVSVRPWSIDIRGGGGSDQVSTHIDGSIAVHMTADLGAGNDNADFVFSNMTLVGPRALTLAVDGGDGKNRIDVLVEHPTFVGAASVDVAVTGGRGNDIITVEGFDPTGDIYGNDRARWNIAVDGGEGNDQIVVLVGNLNAPPDPDLRLDWNIMIDGGGGNDIIDVVAQNVLLAGNPDGSVAPEAFRLQILGGDGKDSVFADLQFDPRSLGMVDAMVFGGRGDDNLTLDIFGVGDPNQISALIDGGPGFDTAHATPNVRVVNCEG